MHIQSSSVNSDIGNSLAYLEIKKQAYPALANTICSKLNEFYGQFFSSWELRDSICNKVEKLQNKIMSHKQRAIEYKKLENLSEENLEKIDHIINEASKQLYFLNELEGSITCMKIDHKIFATASAFGLGSFVLSLLAESRLESALIGGPFAIVSIALFLFSELSRRNHDCKKEIKLIKNELKELNQ